MKRDMIVKAIYKGIVLGSGLLFIKVIEEMTQAYEYYELTGHSFLDVIPDIGKMA